MSDWVQVRNFNELMEGYQKSSYDGTKMPGLVTYLEKIINQNEQIIMLLNQLNQKSPRRELNDKNRHQIRMRS